MLTLQKLGEALIELPERELQGLPLPENLREAVELARSLSKRGALYRQKQYIGKLMRDIDTEAIERAITLTQQQRRAAAREFHEIESWRDRILANGESGVDAFLTSHPQANRRQLHMLLRQAGVRAEVDARRARRALFRYLASVLHANADPS